MGKIVIDGREYTVAKQSKSPVNIQFAHGDWRIKKRNAHESDAAMQKRVQAEVDLSREAVAQGSTASIQGFSTPTPSPSSQRPRKGKPSPPTQLMMAEAERPSKSKRTEPSMGPPPAVSELKKLQKKVREAERLQTLQSERALVPEELEKVAKLLTWRTQIELLQPPDSSLMGTPLATPTRSPLETPTRTPGSVSSSAPTRHAMDAGKAAAVSNAAHEALSSMPRSPEARPSTRATAT